jgi:hypothetical protein
MSTNTKYKFIDTSQILLFAVIVYGQWESSVKQHEATS